MYGFGGSGKASVQFYKEANAFNKTLENKFKECKIFQGFYPPTSTPEKKKKRPQKPQNRTRELESQQDLERKYGGAAKKLNF
jgi:hypothetical protein